MEWECLGILLRGRQPVIWVPARSIVGMHLKPELQPAFFAGRLSILSPFEPKHNESRPPLQKPETVSWVPSPTAYSWRKQRPAAGP